MKGLLAVGVTVLALVGPALALGGASVEAGGEWGQAPNGEFWNGCATRFIHAPAFGFKGADGTWFLLQNAETGKEYAPNRQYHCYFPIDASAARFIDTYLALWRVTRKPEYLAKAKALGATARALDNLARAESEEKAK